MSDEFDFDASDVVAVREDPGQQPELIGQRFHLSIRYSESASVLFRLSYSTNTTAYLQIRVDCIQSLEKRTYNKSSTNPSSPPFLETVRQQLNNMHSVTRLRFQLHGGSNAQLIVPLGYTIGKVSGDSVGDTHGSPESLAAASLFSLYFRHDILKNKQFGKYKWAIKEFPNLPEIMKQHYNECMANVDRLYVGTGGQVLKYNKESPPPAREHCRSPTPSTPLSCGSTVPFNTGSYYRGSPPPYEECPSKEQSPRATSAAIFAESPGLVPPRYSDIKQRNVLDPFQGSRHYGSEDTDIHQIAKRKRPLTAFRPEKTWRSLFDDESNVGHLELQCKRIELQRREIELQHREIKLRHREIELQRREIELQRRKIELQRQQIEQPRNNVDELQTRIEKLEE
ncbi:hypothetical protein CI238_13370 [Colletotrichum incanum]|uniref:Uncharacterized protein n=1 Tax=Colletotrichum incanum TaxID=1573173 RepID=A0A167BM42_COLIC|nr:hypothetical protein CI238_13370 [Colletotrichum incanum]OHW96528.1 hypothetical protein CSPAE12_04821 [Colletotrichum incanum]